MISNNAEGGTGGTAVTPANSGGSSGSAFTSVSPGAGGSIAFSSARKAHGSLSYALSPASGVLCYLVWNADATGMQWSTRLYLYLTGYPSSETILLDVQGTGNATAARIHIDTAGKLKVINSAGAWLATTSNAIPLNQWVRITFRGTVDAANGTITLAFYPGDAGSATETLTLTARNTGTAAVNRAIIGRFTAAGTMATFYVDDLALDTATSAEIGTPNQAPTANAGPDQSVSTGATVTLDGTGSTDPDGTIASYAWTQTGGTTVTLSSASAAQPTFTAPGSAGTLTFSLVVTDNGGATSAADTVVVTVTAADAANAGPDQTAPAWATVTVTGTGSAAGTWSVVSGTATLAGSGATRTLEAVPSNTPGTSATVTLRYTVGTATDDMVVTVGPAPLLWQTAGGLKAGKQIWL